MGIIETPYWNLMLDKRILRKRKNLQGRNCFYHKRWHGVKYGLVVLRKGTITYDDVHERDVIKYSPK